MLLQRVARIAKSTTTSSLSPTGSDIKASRCGRGKGNDQSRRTQPRTPSPTPPWVKVPSHADVFAAAVRLS